MKYTIEGFSQEFATTLKKVVSIRGKEKTIKIDCTDLVILRWFVDFYPNMKKMFIDGREYVWLSHNKLVNDLPILDISKRACIERMQKLVEFEILDYKLVKEGGTFSLYAFGNRYIDLVRKNVHGTRSNDTGGVRSNDIGGDVQPANKDNSIDYPSFNDKEKKESNGEQPHFENHSTVKKSNSFDVIIEAYTSDTVTIELLKEWLKVRKAKRAALTDKAIQMNIAKLDKLAEQSNMTVNEYLEEVICRGWAAFYPITNYGNKQSKQPEQKKGNFDFLAENGSVTVL